MNEVKILSYICSLYRRMASNYNIEIQIHLNKLT